MAAKEKKPTPRPPQPRWTSGSMWFVSAHVPDGANYVDMFTKWVEHAKVEASIAYLSGHWQHSYI